MKQSAGPHAAPTLTRINFDGRSPQLDGQILPRSGENDKIHVPQMQGRHSLKQKTLWDAPQPRQGLVTFE
jgi:hypothetical protein